MVKISALPPDSAPTMSDYAPFVDAETVTTRRALWSAIASLLFNQVNIPTGGGSPVTRATETLYDFVASGGVWTGDSYGASRNASMTAMVLYINGRRISISAVTARTFTASVDTYIDVLDNADGTGTLVYTEVANNAASPALASNSLRVGIIVTAAGSIAAVGSINQGQVEKILPIASSIPYATTDSLGNLICPRDARRITLGHRIITANFTTTNTSITDVTGLSCPVKIPDNRRIKITVYSGQVFSSQAAGNITDLYAREGANTLNFSRFTTPVTSYGAPMVVMTAFSTSGSRTYLASVLQQAAGTLTLAAAATQPAGILVELI